jgi:hypothetical protein
VTLFLHETHRIKGRAEDDFEARFRDEDGWMARLAASDDARLLWYLNQAHGTGPSYRVTTVTAVADGAAWERLAHRIDDGDLAEWAARVDDLRYEVNAKVLLPVAWSPMHDVDLAAVPTEPQSHKPRLYMEDTGWPDVSIDDYVRYWGETYWPLLAGAPESHKLLEIEACWVPALGAGRRPEGILMQRVHSHERLLGLLSTEVPPAMRAPGTYMAEALDFRDQWESRLLRSAPWSPL